MKSRINENDYEITVDMLNQMNDLRVTDGKIEDILNMNMITFTHTNDLMGTNQYLFLWKIGKNGEVIGIDWQTYTYWKEEVMPVRVI